MRQCIRCGGSAYVAYAYGCVHVFDDTPRPLIEIVEARGENVYLASHNGAAPRAMHPTEEGAREEWRRKWRATSRVRGVTDGLRARLRLDVNGEPVTIASGFYETQDAFVEAVRSRLDPTRSTARVISTPLRGEHGSLSLAVWDDPIALPESDSERDRRRAKLRAFIDAGGYDATATVCWAASYLPPQDPEDE